MDKRIQSGPTVLTGNKAAAYGFALAEPDVFGGYPITPSTEITEEVAYLAQSGTIATTYRNTDSELASAALGIGVASAGGRYGTATSSQGLALMCELLHWATTSRLPMVIVNVNRSLGAPWSIHPDQTDSTLFRDFFMPQIYCASAQEALDLVLWAYRLAEDPLVSLPALVCLDGFMLSHTAENVIVPNESAVREFLPALKPRQESVLPNREEARIINLQCPYDWKEHSLRKRNLVAAMRNAFQIIPEIAREWKNIFGGGEYHDGFLRVIGDPHASIAAVSMGAITGTIEEVFAGQSVKVIGIRVFRPFPAEALSRVLQGVSKIVVFDRSILPDGHGVLANEFRSRRAFPPVFEFVGGFGGQNLSEDDFRVAVDTAKCLKMPLDDPLWMGG